MLMIRNALARFRGQEEGATAVEYGIMVALIAAVIIAAVVLIGEQTEQGFDCVGETLRDNATSARCEDPVE